MNWSVFALGDILSLEYGAALPEKNRDVNGKVPVAGSNGIAGYYSQALVKGPGIVIGRKGSAGKVNWFDTDFWAIDTTFYVRLKAPVNMRWIFYLLKQLKLDRLSIVTGVPGLSRNDAYCLKVPLPPLSEQHRIVEILEQADALRKKRAEADAKAERILPALFIKMFGDPATNPMDWKTLTLGDVTKIIYRYPTFYGQEYVASGVPVVRISDILPNHTLSRNLDQYVKVPKEFSDNFPLTLLEPNDTVMAVRGDTTGKIGLVPKELAQSNISPNLIRISPDTNQVKPYYLFLYMLLAANIFKIFINDTAKKSITAGNLKTIPIPIPHKIIQERFESIVSNIIQMNESRCARSEQIENILSSLLQRAFSGDLTAKWREAHMSELLAEIEQQTKILETAADSDYEQLNLIETQ